MNKRIKESLLPPVKGGRGHGTAGHGTRDGRNRRLLLALISGGLLTAAWPTWGVAALAFVGFVPLLLLEDRIA